MNLKFWKKKPRAEEDVNEEEGMDDKTVAMEVPDLESPEPAKQGFFARITTRFTDLASRFRKSPPSDDGEDEAENQQEAVDDKTVAMEVSDLEESPPAKEGLLTRLRASFSALVRRSKKPAEPETAEEEDQPSKAHGKPAPQSDETPPAVKPMHMKKRLIIGGAIGLLILLLVGAGFAAWKIFRPTPEHDETATDSAHEVQVKTPQDEIEALRKKNDELQAQIQALKKEQPKDQPTDLLSGGAEENSSASSNEGEVTLSNKDPKAAAQVLKEAIEAMNASSGSARKPAK